MQTELPKTPGVPSELPESLGGYLARLRAIFGENLKSLAIYGPAAEGRSDPLRQAIANVAVVERVDLEELRRLGAQGHMFGRQRIAAPLVMTPATLAASLDTFPLELIEIVQTRRVVFGHDYFDDLSFADADVRLQCERELKVLLIGMHQGLLSVGDSERQLAQLGAALAPNLLRIMRGVAWLGGQRQSRAVFELVSHVEKTVDRSLAGIYAALNDADMAGWTKYQSLYADIEALGKFVDAF